MRTVCLVLFTALGSGLQSQAAWALAPFEWVRRRLSRREFRFFPDEVNRLRSKRQVRQLLETACLGCLGVEFSPRAAFCHLVVVARRTRPCPPGPRV